MLSIAIVGWGIGGGGALGCNVHPYGGCQSVPHLELEIVGIVLFQRWPGSAWVGECWPLVGGLVWGGV